MVRKGEKIHINVQWLRHFTWRGFKENIWNMLFKNINKVQNCVVYFLIFICLFFFFILRPCKMKCRMWKAPWDTDNLYQNSQWIRWSDCRQRATLHGKGGILGLQERFIERKQLCREQQEGTMASQKEKMVYICGRIVRR